MSILTLPYTRTVDLGWPTIRWSPIGLHCTQLGFNIQPTYEPDDAYLLLRYLKFEFNI